MLHERDMAARRLSAKRAPTRRASLPHVRAFTLIELLVVLTILALLVSILLPALTKAQDLARELICVTNLKSIGQAWYLYLEDNNDIFPHFRNNTHWFYGGKHPSIANEKPDSNPLDSRPLNPYVAMSSRDEKGIGLFRCTRDREIRDPEGTNPVSHGYPTYDYYGNSYMMNSQLLRARDPVTHELILDRHFRRGDITVVEAELIFAGDCQWYYSVFDTRYDAHFHNRDDRVALLFFDGHAAMTQLIRGEDVTPNYTVATYELPEEEEE